jgi:hypothetical protein
MSCIAFGDAIAAVPQVSVRHNCRVTGRSKGNSCATRCFVDRATARNSHYVSPLAATASVAIGAAAMPSRTSAGPHFRNDPGEFVVQRAGEHRRPAVGVRHVRGLTLVVEVVVALTPRSMSTRYTTCDYEKCSVALPVCNTDQERGSK